jgi:CRP/FNR family transcriptional regulator, dissimilatory nitrate respiration regulator
MTEQERPKLDTGAILRHLPMFAQLASLQLEQVAAACREKRVAKGEMLFQRGDKPRGFFIVVTGQIKLAMSSPQGQEKVVEVIGPRHSFGEAVMFMDRPYPVFAEAASDTLVLHIPRQTVIELIERDQSFALAMLAGLSIRLHSLIQDVESYSLRSSSQRIIGYLLQLCPPEGEGAVEVELPIPKQVIASLLNLTPETFSRILHDLHESGLIAVHGKQIRIADLRRLREFDF